ncbi:MAG: hypothetical protein HYU02_05695 [Thaumarchaeota archaeon]|nr:hypothetical protein [Nitrososphaerota archaeon]
MAALVLGGTGQFLNSNNLIGRVTYGLIALDLKVKKDDSYKGYLDSCTSIYEDIDLESKSNQLLSLFDFEKQAKVSELKNKLMEVKPLLNKVTSEKNDNDILKTRKYLEEILSDLYELVRSQSTER